MPLPLLSYTDYGPTATDKINAAIQAFNAVQGFSGAGTALGTLASVNQIVNDPVQGNAALLTDFSNLTGSFNGYTSQIGQNAAAIVTLRAQIGTIVPDDVITLDPNFLRAWTDGIGNAALGVQQDGQTYVAAMHRRLVAYTMGASGARDVYVGSDTHGEINLSGGEFPDHVLGGADSGTITYYGRPGDGTLVKRQTLVQSINTFDHAVTTVFHIPVHGQSNTVGTNNYKVLTTTPLRVGRALMFNAGTKTLANLHDYTQLNTVLSDANIASLVDTYEIAQDAASLGYGETVCSYQGNAYLGRAAATTATINSIHGIGSQPIATLTKGTVPYANLIKAVRRANFLVRLSGRRYAVPYVVWIQGESDCSRTAAAYLADLVALQAALDADIKRITGQTANVKLCMDGMSIAPGSGVPLAMLTAATTMPDRFILTGPRYQLAYVDAFHHTALSDAWLGCYEGKAMGIDQFSGAPWLPLYMKSATISGTAVTTKWNIPQGGQGLTFDNVTVSDPTGGNYGLRFLDNAPGTPAAASVVLQNPTITKPQITQIDTIVCQLTGTPTGPNPRIEVAQYTDYNGAQDGAVVPAPQAGPKTSPRSCIRDQSTDSYVITDKTAGTSSTLGGLNWACHSSVPLTAGA